MKAHANCGQLWAGNRDQPFPARKANVSGRCGRIPKRRTKNDDEQDDETMTDVVKYQLHPACAAWPQMSDSELKPDAWRLDPAEKVKTPEGIAEVVAVLESVTPQR
jgi:hypothetical protein